MGEKKRKLTRLKAFQQDHPFCCICGGSVVTQTIEHAPPKIMFWDKRRLQGMEVPACKRCNNNSGPQDQLAALIAVMQSPVFYDGLSDERKLDYLSKLTKGCLHNIDGFESFFSNGGTQWVESKGVLQPHSKLKFKPELFTEHLNGWAVKQCLAHWYDKTGRVFSGNGIIIVRWLTNYELSDNPELESVISLFQNSAELIQGSQKSTDQFFIRYPNVKDGDNIDAIFCAYHGTAFIGAMIDNAEIIKKLELNPLGNHAACFKTCAEDGIYEVHLPL
ncbi:hypothetical protein [Hellea balneolensis]|uniref:hypothetical protein n=1 Tax=Hellea balneolensis TaxID=287478 RepID=UPI000427C102|nr:hypothetical protein [Hellea balneolensis]